MKWTANSFESFIRIFGEMKEIYGEGGYYEITMTPATRTQKQNNSIHLWFRQIAQILKEKDVDKRDFFKEGYFREWREDDIKDDVWKPVQLAMTDKKSTTELDRKEITDISEVIMRKLAELGISLPFPHQEGK